MRLFGILGKTDFFPPAIQDWDKVSSLCIGTKSRSLGDALALSSLPRLIKETYPHVHIEIFPRAFNRYVFRGNPYVSRFTYWPESVFGDDANEGSGQLIKLKENFFGIKNLEKSKPEIYLMDPEKKWMKETVVHHTFPENRKKPLVLIHPWGGTRSQVAQVEFWDQIVARYKDRFRFWQVGVIGHSAIQGCEYYFLLPHSHGQVRKLFSIFPHAQAFLGVDSGPMHIARAFNIPSLIFLDHAEPKQVFESRKAGPYFKDKNWLHASLYEENTYHYLQSTRDKTRSDLPDFNLIDSFFR